jgi:hypothetical protein
MTSNTDVQAGHTHRHGTVTIKVNHHPVRIADQTVTAREIKLAAIRQGLAIEESFQLSVLQGRRYHVLADDAEVRVHPDQEFLAVAPDDNS